MRNLLHLHVCFSSSNSEGSFVSNASISYKHLQHIYRWIVLVCSANGERPAAFFPSHKQWDTTMWLFPSIEWITADACPSNHCPLLESLGDGKRLSTVNGMMSWPLVSHKDSIATANCEREKKESQTRFGKLESSVQISNLKNIQSSTWGLYCRIVKMG
jgi:hypothetical protein